eukprot:m.65204 g.65204  ORF g.65204 m.65204 type:complete len:178 (+) comp19618_c0_seq1:718-1251(+)
MLIEIFKKNRRTLIEMKHLSVLCSVPNSIFSLPLLSCGTRQFPHFNSLSWNLRPEYSKAGYRMMSVTDPGLCRRVALRYALAMLPICLVAPLIGMTSWYFVCTATIVNLYLLHGSWRFYQDANDRTARQLFFGSIVHLPVLLLLFMLHKKRNPTASEALETSKGGSCPVPMVDSLVK